MKVKDICKTHGLDSAAFQTWLWSSGYQYKTSSMGGVEVTDGQDIGQIVEAFRAYQEGQKEETERAAAESELARQQKQEALANLIITPGFSFDGYTITKYSGYISGDHAVQIERGTQFWFGGATNVADALMKSLVEIRRQALAELKEAAFDLGCNAIIGVDFDYITVEPETTNTKGEIKHLPYVFGVTANGNAVVIEKNRPSV